MNEIIESECTLNGGDKREIRGKHRFALLLFSDSGYCYFSTIMSNVLCIAFGIQIQKLSSRIDYYHCYFISSTSSSSPENSLTDLLCYLPLLMWNTIFISGESLFLQHFHISQHFIVLYSVEKFIIYIYFVCYHCVIITVRCVASD